MSSGSEDDEESRYNKRVGSYTLFTNVLSKHFAYRQGGLDIGLQIGNWMVQRMVQDYSAVLSKGSNVRLTPEDCTKELRRALDLVRSLSTNAYVLSCFNKAEKKEMDLRVKELTEDIIAPIVELDMQLNRWICWKQRATGVASFRLLSITSVIRFVMEMFDKCGETPVNGNHKFSVILQLLRCLNTLATTLREQNSLSEADTLVTFFSIRGTSFEVPVHMIKGWFTDIGPEVEANVLAWSVLGVAAVYLVLMVLNEAVNERTATALSGGVCVKVFQRIHENVSGYGTEG